MVIAQFWAFANDIYTQKKGERLFGVIGIGSSLGAILGALVAGWLFDPIGPYAMMVCAAVLLGVAMIISNWIHHREKGQADKAHAEDKSADASGPLGPAGGFQLIFKHRYLLLIAFLVLISNLVNTTGEFILGKTVEVTAQSMSAEGSEAQQKYIGEFYSNFYFWVNLVSAILQMFVVSRIMQHLGVGPALFFLPVLALGGYLLMAVAPILRYIQIAKIAENSTDYSIQNTARHALFLPTSREAKYKAKAAIDSFFWRVGDTLTGVLVFVGTQLAFGIQAFATANIVLVAIWLLVAYAIVRFLKKGPSATRIAA
jgi:ATP:ADP antiporter, AAA family